MTTRPNFYASIGMPFYWQNDEGNIALGVIAVPTGWACTLQHPDNSTHHYMIPDKDHSMNPRSLWNDESHGQAITISDAYEHQHLADHLHAFDQRKWRDDTSEPIPGVIELINSAPTEEEINMTRWIATQLAQCTKATVRMVREDDNCFRIKHLTPRTFFEVTVKQVED